MSIDVQNEPIQESGSELTAKERRLELAVFLFLIVPSLALSLFTIRQGNVSFVLAAVAIIVRDLSLVSLILFFLWRNGEDLAQIGWTWQHIPKELLLGISLFVPCCVLTALLEWALLKAGLSTPATPLPSFLEPKGRAEISLAVLLVTVVAVAEETIFRGYLLLRLRAVLKNTTGAVLASSLIFSLGHGYEGSAGLATVGVMGAIFAVVYLWRGSLLAPIVMHFLQDFLGIVLAPVLGLK